MVDPLLVILGCQAILLLRERMKARNRKRVPARDLETARETGEIPAAE
jgi:hypothetical protein